jgi:hypothetical protein
MLSEKKEPYSPLDIEMSASTSEVTSFPSLLTETEISSRPTSKFLQFQQLLEKETIDMKLLSRLSWSGIPHPFRAQAWKLLLGYIPYHIDRRDFTLSRKRMEYGQFIEHYIGGKHSKNVLDSKTIQQVNV